MVVFFFSDTPANVPVVSDAPADSAMVSDPLTAVPDVSGPLVEDLILPTLSMA